jgi:uncharacterized membrane protein YfcA
MLITPFVLFILFLSGICTGLLGAILGTGGGVFLIPILVIGLDVPMHHAVATSIVTVIATSSAVASANVERGTANMRLGMTLEIATALGALTGGLVAAWLSATTLETLFGFLLLPVALLMWRGKGHESAPVLEPQTSPSPLAKEGWDGLAKERELGALGSQYEERGIGLIKYRVKRLWAGLGISYIAGNVSGLLGVGGGIFKVPALHLVCGVPIKAAAATSNFMIGVTAAASATLYYGRGEIWPALTAAVTLGVLCGSVAGSLLNRRIEGRIVQKIFALLLLATALEMLYRVFLQKA